LPLLKFQPSYVLTAGEEIKQFGKKILPNMEFRNLYKACLSCRSYRRNKWRDV